MVHDHGKMDRLDLDSHERAFVEARREIVGAPAVCNRSDYDQVEDTTPGFLTLCHSPSWSMNSASREDHGRRSKDEDHSRIKAPRTRLGIGISISENDIPVL